MMSDAYSGGEATINVAAEAQWRRFIGRNLQVESKARPAEFWAGEASQVSGIITKVSFKPVSNFCFFVSK